MSKLDSFAIVVGEMVFDHSTLLGLVNKGLDVKLSAQADRDGLEGPSRLDSYLDALTGNKDLSHNGHHQISVLIFARELISADYWLGMAVSTGYGRMDDAVCYLVTGGLDRWNPAVYIGVRSSDGIVQAIFEKIAGALQAKDYKLWYETRKILQLK